MSSPSKGFGHGYEKHGTSSAQTSTSSAEASDVNQGGHVEAICMYRLDALLTTLKENKCDVASVEGYIRFKGEMAKVCPACDGVQKALKMEAIELVRN